MLHFAVLKFCPLIDSQVATAPHVMTFTAVMFLLFGAISWVLPGNPLYRLFYVVGVAFLNATVAYSSQRAIGGWESFTSAKKHILAWMVTLMYIANYAALMGFLVLFDADWLHGIPNDRDREQES